MGALLLPNCIPPNAPPCCGSFDATFVAPLAAPPAAEAVPDAVLCALCGAVSALGALATLEKSHRRSRGGRSRRRLGIGDVRHRSAPSPSAAQSRPVEPSPPSSPGLSRERGSRSGGCSRGNRRRRDRRDVGSGHRHVRQPWAMLEQARLRPPAERAARVQVGVSRCGRRGRSQCRRQRLYRRDHRGRRRRRRDVCGSHRDVRRCDGAGAGAIAEAGAAGGEHPPRRQRRPRLRLGRVDGAAAGGAPGTPPVTLIESSPESSLLAAGGAEAWRRRIGRCVANRVADRARPLHRGRRIRRPHRRVDASCAHPGDASANATIATATIRPRG